MRRRKGFNMVYPAIWRSKRFLALPTDRARLLLLYFLTSPHQNSTGCFRIPDGYATADLGWPIADYRAELGRLAESGLVAHDPETDDVYVTGWFRFCPPTNDNHASGVMTRISELDSDHIRGVMEVEFTEANKARLLDRIVKRQKGEPDADDPLS